MCVGGGLLDEAPGSCRGSWDILFEMFSLNTKVNLVSEVQIASDVVVQCMRTQGLHV